MSLKVRLPRILHRGLEGHHEHTLRAQLPGELVGDEGLTEAHLRVPQETRHGMHIFRPAREEVGVHYLYRFGLLPAHRKGQVMRAGEPLPRAQFGEHGLQVLERAAHPLQFGVIEALPDERRAYLVVAEDGAVVALGGFVEFDGKVLDGGGLELFGNALLHVARRLPHLEETRVRLVVDGIGVDARPGFRLGCEDFLDGLTRRSRPSDGSWTR